MKSLAARRKKILELSQTKSALSVLELAQLFGVSEMTVRRDLRYLDKEGLLKRVHGGAVADRGRSYEPPYLTRVSDNSTQKEAIGRKGAEFVTDGDSLALDVGTTTLEVAKCIAEMQNLTIITFSLRIAVVLANSPGVRLVVSGGILREGEQSMVGHLPERALRDFYVDKAFIGVGGLDTMNGLTEFNLDDALVKRVIVEHAKKVIVVADSSKLGRTCLNAIAPLSRVDLIVTDAGAPPEMVALLQQRGIQVILA